MTQSGYNANFAQNYTNQLGRLHTNMSNRNSGKRVLEWSFELPGDKPRSAPVAVHVSIEQGRAGLEFVARATEGAMVLRNSDIEALYAQVESFLRERVGSMMHIDWEDWFEVQVSGGDSCFLPDNGHAAMGGELKIQVSRLKRGTHPVTGQTVTVHRNHVLVPFPEAKRRDESVEGDWLSSGPCEVAYLPATPENEAALREIIDRLAQLRARLSHVLQQELIQASLANVSTQLVALTGPAGDAC